MTTYLADTSAWIDYLRTPTAPLRSVIDRVEVAHTEPVAMELLSGARDDQATDRLNRMLAGTPLLPFDSASDFSAATELRRSALRWSMRVGVVDCLILAVAGRSDARLLTRDRAQADLALLHGIPAELLGP